MREGRIEGRERGRKGGGSNRHRIKEGKGLKWITMDYKGQANSAGALRYCRTVWELLTSYRVQEKDSKAEGSSAPIVPFILCWRGNVRKSIMLY